MVDSRRYWLMALGEESKHWDSCHAAGIAFTAGTTVFVYRGAACETPGACGLAQPSILLVNTHLPWIADWMRALGDRRHAERWK